VKPLAGPQRYHTREERNRNMNTKTALEYHPTIKDLPAGERPRERLKKYGAGSLSNAELLAIILRTGVGGENVLNLAARLLAKFGGLIGLARAGFSELCGEKGIGVAKAAQLKAAMELGRRLLIASPEERLQIKSPADAANLMMIEMSMLEQEHMRLILLDSKNYILDTPTMYIGSLNTSVIRVGELFREAIKQNSAAIIVIHNHPSGDPTPSPEDIAVTELITQAGQLLDIDVLDHLIIGQQRYVSLKERGLGFK
jgi:DNA repair protein RadC